MKKLFSRCSWLITVLICLGILFSVKTFAKDSAADDSLSGSLGKNITWTLEGSSDSGYTIRISGSGDTPDYDYTSDIPWYSHINEIKSVIVEDGITGLGKSSFYKSTSIQSVKLADSVRSIGEMCFFRNGSLEKIELGNGLTSIGEAAFSVSNLKKVSLPIGITHIESDTFYGCKQLESINLEHVKSIGRRAFYFCSNLSGINLSADIEQLEYAAFRGCSSIDKVNIGSKLSELNEQVFAECSSLKEIYIPDNITAIQRGAFYQCTALGQVTGAKNVEVLGEMAFNGAKSLETYPFGNKVRSIGNSAFSGCSSFKIDKIPDSVTFMGTWAFGSTAIETIEFGSGLTYINSYAFSYCSNLTKVTFPSNIESIKIYAFSHCPKLKNVIFTEGLKTINEGAFTGSIIKEAVIPKSVSAIGSRAFPDSTKLTLLNDKLTNMGGNTYKVIHKAKASFYYNYDYAYEVLELVNKIRKENNLEPMTMDVKLLDNAMYRASELTLYFSHQSPIGQYNTSIGASENVAMWQRTPQEVVDAWMSDSHKEPILSSKYTAIGVGAVASNGQLYWAQEFRSKVSEEAKKSSYKTGNQVNTIEYTTDIVTDFHPEQTSLTIKEKGESSIVSLLKRAILLPDSVHYVSSDEKVCTVSKDGKLTGKTAGKATITIYAADNADEYALQTTVQVEVEHNWQSKYTVDKEATCTENGSQSIHCDVCNAINENRVKVIKATGHKAEKIAGKAASCTEDGRTEGSKCSVCGEILKKQEIIKATGHKWSAWEVTKEASETEEGSRRRVCENDKTHIETEVIPVLAHVHKLTKTEAKKASCTENGNKEYYICSGCKKLFADADAAKEISKEDTVIKATGHKAEKIVGKAASCTEDGRTEGSKCSVCGEILKKQEVIKATGHKWSAWEVTKEASETEEGSRRRVCENDKTHVETEVIPVLAHVHKLTKTEAKKASCTENGNKEYYICSGCKKLFADADAAKEISKEDTVIKATGHKAEKIVGKAASCTEDGRTEGSKCSVCGEILKKQEVIKATGHKWSAWEVTKEASETEEGSRRRVCENDKTHVETEVIPVLAHVHKLTKTEAKKASCTENGNKEYYICSGCKKLFADADAAKEISKEDTVIKATGHKAEKIVGKAASCTEDGRTEGSKCSVCGEILKKQEVIKATGHKWSAWEVTKEASETEEGSRRRVCENDKTHVEIEVIPVLAHVHKLTKTEAKKASCTENGNKEYYICSGCKKLFADADAAKEISKEDTVIKATGHKAEKIVGKAASCTEDGRTEGSKCSVCGEILKKQEVIKATGHKWSAWEVTKEASETEEGSRRRVCENDKTHVETEVIPVLAHVHKLTKTEAKKASCTENGNKEYYVCSGCKKLFADADAAKEISKEDTVIKATGHKAEKIVGKAASCTEDGRTEGSKCSVCGEILKKQEVIKATGHKWSAWEVTKEASETEEGSRRRVCENDKTHVETEVIPVLAHMHKLTKTEAKKASCTENGNKEYYVCSGCKKLFADADAAKEISKEDTVIKATGHKAEKIAGKAATYTENGLTEGSKCSICGTVVVAQKVIPKKDIKGDVKNPTSVNRVEKKITGNRSDGDIKDSTFNSLQLRAKKAGKNYINLFWTNVKGASGYIIYGNRCNSNGKVYPLRKVISTAKMSQKIMKLKKGTYYKYVVIAYKMTGAGQKVIASSKTIHVATVGGKVGNYKKVKLNKKIVKLKCGKVFKIKAEQVPEKKKLKVKRHRDLCFESSNPAIAAVSASGRVEAKKKGRCVIYVYSQSGTFNKMTVRVK